MAPLEQVLHRAKELGFFGPAPIDEQIAHAMIFAEHLPGASAKIADIGAGGGLPSLPLLVSNTELRATLIDTNERRCSFLAWAIVELDLAERTSVELARAEELGKDGGFREQFDVVIARGFGPPAITLECAAPLVSLGGRVVISEPPESRQWPSKELASIGLEFEYSNNCAVFNKVDSSDEQSPRNFRTMQRHPIF